jgi:2-polyprenyl-3-methyl-5-hydroxy-6-metoxy-1,4-benzoquinol methylase
MPLGAPVLDLGQQPLIDDPVPPDVATSIPLAPVRIVLCATCGLAQLDTVPRPRIPNPTVAATLAASRHGHGRRRPGASAAHLAAWADWVLARTRLPPGSLVVDVASGDGAALQRYAERGMAVLGHELHADLVEAANADGLPTIRDAPGGPASVAEMARRGGARLVVVNHALAHADDLQAMAGQVGEMLVPGGWVAIETLDLGAILRRGLFDVLGHAHRSYFSIASLASLLAAHELETVAVQRDPLHGGTLRVLARSGGGPKIMHPPIDRLRAEDERLGVTDADVLGRLGDRAAMAGERLHDHLERAARSGTSVVGYGAPGRAVSILSRAEVGVHLLPFTVDRDTSKHGLALPGSGVPVRPVDALDSARPREVLVLAWTWAHEITLELARVGGWGGRLVAPLPRLRTLPRPEDEQP